MLCCRNACDEADSNSERHSHDLQREGASPEARAVEVDIETRSGNSAHAAPARASPQKESLSGWRRGKVGEGKRQKTSHRVSPFTALSQQQASMRFKSLCKSETLL